MKGLTELVLDKILAHFPRPSVKDNPVDNDHDREVLFAQIDADGGWDSAGRVVGLPMVGGETVFEITILILESEARA